MLGRPWADIAAELQLDSKGEVAQALASQDTWSGIVVPWPVDGDDDRLPVEMSGLPVFDRDRHFAGFRGFGICRDVERLAASMPPRAGGGALIAEPQNLRTPTCCRSARRRHRADAGAQPGRAQRLSGARARTERPAEEDRRPDRRRSIAPTISAPSAVPRRCRRDAGRREPRAMATPPATRSEAGRSSTGCRSASWSTASTT